MVKRDMKPKKVLTAYNFFYREHIPHLKSSDEGKNLDKSQTMNTMALHWSKLDSDERQKYKLLH